MKKKTVLTIAFIVLISIVMFVVYSLLFGKLFPFTPIVIGFKKHEIERAIVYVEKGAVYTQFTEIDSLIPRVEAFHQLQFFKKPRIFLFADKKTYKNRSLSKARFCAFYNGDIVVSPWARQEALDGSISIEIYLGHELSHSIIYQHTGIIHAAGYPQWLLEGIAVYSVQQMGTSFYPSKEKTYQYIKEGNFVHPNVFKTSQENNVQLNVEYRVTFMYSEFACIVDYLIDTFGKENFLNYMNQLFDGSSHDDVFRNVYQIEFDQFIQNFKKFVLDKI